MVPGRFPTLDEVEEAILLVGRVCRSTGHVRVGIGASRQDVNVSVRLVGQKELGAKVEIKNMNSFAFIQQAIDYEIDRQVQVLERGGKVSQETRGFDSDRGETFVLRMKEDAMRQGYTQIFNVKLESANIGGVHAQGMPIVEVFAYGTAIKAVQTENAA